MVNLFLEIESTSSTTLVSDIVVDVDFVFSVGLTFDVGFCISVESCVLGVSGVIGCFLLLSGLRDGFRVVVVAGIVVVEADMAVCLVAVVIGTEVVEVVGAGVILLSSHI